MTPALIRQGSLWQPVWLPGLPVWLGYAVQIIYFAAGSGT